MIGTWLERFCKVLRVLLAVLMGTLAIPVAMQVLSRYTPLIPTYLWTEELATFIFIWIVMIGSMVAVWDQTAFALIFVWYGIEYAEFGARQKSVMMRANKLITHVSVPIAGVVWSLFAGYRFYESIAEFRLTKNSRKLKDTAQ